MLRKVDEWLNAITMYKVMLYGLLVVGIYAFVLAGFGLIWPTWWNLGATLTVITVSCLVSNWVLARIFRAPTNVESTPITALILFLIMNPSSEVESLAILAGTSVVAVASKYVMAWRKKHIFNPVAVALVVGALLGSGEAYWWAASKELMVVVLIVGLLIVRKVRKFGMFGAFVLSVLVMIVVSGLQHGDEIGERLVLALTSFPIIFMGTVMLTEPLTSPTKQRWQVVYGFLVGVLFAVQFEIGPFYSTPELALIVGNVLAFIVNPKYKLILKLKKRVKTAHEMYDYVFEQTGKFTFEPGQYMEWTLPHSNIDIRGMRRYFTIASSPTEKDIHLGVKVVEGEWSSFKHHLHEMKAGDEMVATAVAGDFVLPQSRSEKLVFMAGGIGVTPFRSMVKYLLDTGQTRDVIMFYVCRTESDFAYREVFDAGVSVGIRMVYVITRGESAPKNWKGETGYVDAAMITRQVKDWSERTFYISGPHGMVTSYQDVLDELGVQKQKVVVDYFPGF